MVDEEKKIFAGKLYCPGNPELKAIKLRSHNLSIDYNKLHEDDREERDRIVHSLFAEFGEGSFIQGPMQIHYGTHTSIGKGVFFNFNLTIQDDAPVTIGDDCNFGPNLTIVTPQHPLIGSERKAFPDSDGVMKHLCYAQPVKIGHDCWFGANVTVCPGVTIGDNVVIGAGSVVTHDIPSNTVAVGVPCKVLREITEKDSLKNHPELFS